jgi:hypothetical protein
MIQLNYNAPKEGAPKERGGFGSLLLSLMNPEL